MQRVLELLVLPCGFWRHNKGAGTQAAPLSVWAGPQGPRELVCEKVTKAGDVLAYATSLHVPNTAYDSEA